MTGYRGCRTPRVAVTVFRTSPSRERTSGAMLVPHNAKRDEAVRTLPVSGHARDAVADVTPVTAVKAEIEGVH